MPRLVNTNEHRVYYGEGGEHMVRPGAAFEGSDSDVGRPGLVDADSDEGRAALAASGHSDDTVNLDRRESLAKKQAELAADGTAPLRDRYDGETGDTIKGTGETNPAVPPNSIPTDATKGGTITTESGPLRGAVQEPSVDATDAAVELAQQKGVDLSDVEGTGENGRVTVDDVRAASKEE